MRTMTLGMCAIGLLTSGACVADHEDVAAEVYARTVLGNGVDLNSASMNGRTLNGFFMNGRTLNGRTLNAWSLNGRTLNGRTLNGTLFAGTQVVDGQVVTVSGTQMIGSLLTIRADGVDLTLRFDDIYKDPANPTGDVYFYDVSVHDAVAGTWTSLCADDEGQPLAAVPLQHYWNDVTGARVNDADAVTFACRGAVLAKCVEWGYRPWASATRCVNGTCTQVSLADHHQACTRMARADYCGDGTPHTFDATPIDLYDRLSAPVQAEATRYVSGWAIEAEWGPNGALCVGDELRLKMFDDLSINYDYPTCLDAIDDVSNCGNFSSSRGARLANRYCYKWMDDPSACEENNDDEED